MKRRRSLRVVLGVVLALGVRTAVAAPLQVTAEMRAVTHCAGHMGGPVSVPESRRCCKVSSQADDPLTLSAVPPAPPPAVFVITTLPVATHGAGTTPVARLERRGERDGPPLYLGLRTFRC